jgi:hypothetical protein
VSYIHVAWAFKQKNLPPTRKFVLVALAERCNKDTLRCDPSIERLSEDTCLNERSVRRALADLCESGLIGRHRPRRADGSYGHYRYTFPGVEVRVTSPPADSVSGGPPAPVSGKPEVHLEPEELLAAAPRNGQSQRPRNEIWDTLAHMFGEPTTPSAIKARGKVCSELRQAGATAEEILERGKKWPNHYDGATLTEYALVKHWHTLARKPLRRR